MTPAAIIQQAAAEGVILVSTPAGTIKATGSGDAVARWLPVIREHKAELLTALGNDPFADPAAAEARRQRVMELAGHLRIYADRNGFTQADFDEAMQVAIAGDLEGWLAYIKGQNETRH